MFTKNVAKGSQNVVEKTTTLNRRLYQVILVSNGIALLLAYFAFVLNDHYAYQRNLINSVAMLAEVTAKNSVGVVSFQEDEAAQKLLKTLYNHADIRHAAIVMVDGALFVEMRNRWKKRSQARILSTTNIGDGYVELSNPIRLGTKTIGHVYLLADLDGQTARLYQFTVIGLAIILLALTIALLLSRRLIKTISQPIANLVTLAENVEEHRNYSVNAKRSNIKELNTLVKSINSMLAAIRQRDRELLDNEKNLKHQINYDPLTKLPNRMMFLGRLEQAIHMAKRRKTLMAVLFVDLDQFKQINDTLGHKTGDAILQEVAQLLQTCVRDTDTVARLAGDEFTIILEGIQENRNAEFVAKQILSAFSAKVKTNDQEIVIGASIGISVYPHDAEHGETLLHHADTAMYFAKKRGRNTFKFYNPSINAEAERRNRIESDLQIAIEKNEIQLYYQPKIEMDGSTIVGFEALLRWDHPELGWISPLEFVSIAEASQLIKSLGEWVLRQACRQVLEWHNHGYTTLSVAVNVSARQFHLSDFALDVARILLEEGVSSECIELELTESLVMDLPEKVILMLHTLKNIGVKLSIDDFGTGYSSLSYLQRFPIDTLKIDRSFINEIGESRGGNAITLAIISLAHTLDLQVIAEGVETDEQLEFLRQHHCEQIQGYYISRPLPATDVLPFLSTEQSRTPSP